MAVVVIGSFVAVEEEVVVAAIVAATIDTDKLPIF